MDPKTGKHSVLDTLTSCLIIYADGNDIGKDNEAGVPQILINFHFTFTLLFELLLIERAQGIIIYLTSRDDLTSSWPSMLYVVYIRIT